MQTVVNLTKKKTPPLDWKKIQTKILGSKYQLGIVLADNVLMKKHNRKYRQKNKIADTLSFPYSKTEGDIFLNINCTPNKILLLFIHSLLHLQGLKHGKKMETKEDLYYNYFYGT